MLLRLRTRMPARALITTIIATAAMLTPIVAHAEPPSNDDFDHATPISALPFTAQQDTIAATQAVDDPAGCNGYEAGHTVWFRYTAAEDGWLRATSTGSDFRVLMSAFTGARGDLRQVQNGCGFGRATFRVVAGTTYHLMINGEHFEGGALSFAVDAATTPANDDFANAEAISTLPLTRELDLATASFEADEPESTCLYDETWPSVWYTYTTDGPSKSITADILNTYEGAVTVYTGSSVHDVREIACVNGQNNDPTAFRVNPSTTYYLRAAARVAYQPITLSVAEAPAPSAGISTSPSSPTVYDTVRFEPQSWRGIDNPMTASWDFGDGTTAPATTEAVHHRYTKDGVYPVTMRATTPDGRTATVTTQIMVNTHDVSITKFDVPTSAREGESKSIKVTVGNTRYLETVTVRLDKRTGDYWTSVGSLTLEVPAHPRRTVQFPFAYTFTPDDAIVGKVSFRAVAELEYPSRDAVLADNEVISLATKVKPRNPGMTAV